MSPEERLIYEITHLTENGEDELRSKSNLYVKVIEQKNKKAAKELQKYWGKTGNWKNNSVSIKQRKK